MNGNQYAGWAMVLGAVLLLGTLGQLEWLVILLPLSLLSAYAIGRTSQDKIPADARHQKG